MTNPLRVIARAPAHAVGAGIARSILAAATRADADSPEAWIHFCTTAADEAHAAVMEHPPVVERDISSAVLLLRGITGPEEGGPELSSTEWIELDGQELTHAAHQAALVAFRACMPKLTGRRATQAYIACVAVGVQRGYFTGAESKALLYTAQLALSAHPSRRKPTRRK